MLAPQVSSRTFGRPRVLRFVAAVIGLLVCGHLCWVAARMGVSRLLSDYGARAGLPIAADRAVSFSPSDPEAHYIRASVLSGVGEHAEAIREFERAVASRPRDYILWLELGQARDQAGDVEGALAAFREAAWLAPYYAHPRWQLGNLLLRAEGYDEAFSELRRAVASNPSLLPNLVDLAYGLYSGDARAVEHAVQPQTTAARLTLARLFARRGKTEETMRLFSAAGQVSDQERQALLVELLNNQRFPEAYEVWASGHAERDPRGSPPDRVVIIDGGFENEIRADDPGFGWQIPRDLRAASVSADASEPHGGARSLLLDWSGDSQPSVPVVSQLILIKPKTRYRLSFAARTESLVTGGVPVVTVSAAGAAERLLAQSAPLPQGTNGWRQYSVEFETAETTRAALIAIRRQSCTVALCPIFGRTWFDDFALNYL